MVYGCGCVVVGKPSRFMTSAEMRFFWLPLSTMNCSGEPFTHIWEWKRCSSYDPDELLLQVNSCNHKQSNNYQAPVFHIIKDTFNMQTKEHMK
jgi:hypothetical protein